MGLDIKTLNPGDMVVANGTGLHFKGKQAVVRKVINDAFFIDGTGHPFDPDCWELIDDKALAAAGIGLGGWGASLPDRSSSGGAVNTPIPSNSSSNWYNHMLVGAVKGLQEMVHALAKEKGWYDPPKTDVEALALVITEVCEAIEEIRGASPSVYQVHSTGTLVEPGPDWKDDKKPEGELIELADAVIRVLDYCEHKGYNLGEAILMKHRYNQNRQFRHGGKKL